MTSAATPLTRATLIASLALLLTGCTSAPSVAPLLRLADQALRDEANRLTIDAQRHQAALAQSRRALADAYERDLQETPQLDKQWLLEATDVYVAAREALLRHELAVEAEHHTRRDNLLTASQAQQRAVAILEQQDALITDTLGLNLWQLLYPAP